MTRARSRRWENVPLIDAAAPVPTTNLEALAEVAGVLVELERRRQVSVAMRDHLVAEERARGTSWDVLAAAAGTTRQALMKRDGRASS